MGKIAPKKQYATVLSAQSSQPLTSKPIKKKTPAKSGLSKTNRAELIFSVLMILRKLRDMRKFKRQVQPRAAVYLASVLEYLTAEVLQSATEVARIEHRHSISPRHIQLAVRSDDELNHLFSNVTIAEGGVIPFIIPVLLSKPSSRRASTHQRSD